MTEFLYRRNTVLETLRGGRRRLYRLWLQEDLRQAQSFIDQAEARGVPVESTTRQRLSQLAGDRSHQGVLLEAGPYPYSDLETMLEQADDRGEQPFLLLLDLVQGPQNIGMLLRTAEACGVHGVIIQKRRAPDLTPHVAMYSAGASEHLLIAQVTNLVTTMKRLQSSGIWLVGLDLSPEAHLLGQVDLNMAVGIIVGHEGSGLRRLVRETCDYLLKLPMRGRMESLNAASAGAILLYAAWQARGFQGVAQ